MNLEKYPFPDDLKKMFNRLQEELNELAVAAGEASKAISKMRRFGATSFHKDGSTGIEKLNQRMEEVEAEYSDVTKCLNRAAALLHRNGIEALEDWA